MEHQISRLRMDMTAEVDAITARYVTKIEQLEQQVSLVKQKEQQQPAPIVNDVITPIQDASQPDPPPSASFMLAL
jgi:hypothetical protein